MKTIIAILAIGLSASAFAGRTTSTGSQGLDWDDFREACLHPGQFHAQRPANNIRVSCADKIVSWEAAQTGSMSLARSRDVTSALQSDKYHVSKMTSAVGIGGVSVNCPRYAEVELTLAYEFQITCEQATAYKGTLTQLCSEKLDDVRASNPNLVVRKLTGRTQGNCDRSTGQE